MAFEVIVPEGMNVEDSPLSPGTKAGDFVFVSGQASVGEDGKIISDTFENEFRRSMENVRKILNAAGLDLKDVVKVVSYVADRQYSKEYAELYKEYFKDPKPVRTTLVNCIPADVIKYEIDVIAYAGK